MAVRADVAGHQPEPGADEPGGGVERRHLVQHAEDRFVERDIDHLPACLLAAAEREQRADGAIEAGDVVGKRGGARRQRRPAGDAGEMSEAAEGVRNAGEARAVLVGASLAVARDAHQHQAGVHGLQLVRPQAPLLHGAGPEILAEDVGLGDEALEERSTLGLAEVEGDGLLVALLREPSIAVAALAGRPEFAQRIARPRLLDLDDLGAELAEDGGCERPSDEGRKVDDADAMERQLLRHSGRKRRSGRHVNRRRGRRAIRRAGYQNCSLWVRRSSSWVQALRGWR